MYYKCTACKKIENMPPKPVWLCSCGKPLSVYYGWEEKQRDVSIDTADESLWRYGNVLPEESVINKVSLGEGWTPLFPIGNNVYIKDETVNPTGSFKDRGMSLAITMAKVQGVETICLPSAGNAGISAAAYCREAGIECHVFLPETIPEPFKKETDHYNANLMLSGQTISDAAKEMLDNKKNDWFDISTLKEPFRVEGKKTLGYEIAEQLGWKTPDNVVVPVAGSSLITKIWKAFHEFEMLGLVDKVQSKIFAAQATGCCPVTTAIKNGSENITPVKPNTIAKSIAIGNPADGYYGIKTANTSGGYGEDISDDEIVESMKLLAETEGIFTETAGGVTVGVTKKLVEQGRIKPDETTVICITGNGLKTQEALTDHFEAPAVIEPKVNSFEEVFENSLTV